MEVEKSLAAGVIAHIWQSSDDGDGEMSAPHVERVVDCYASRRVPREVSLVCISLCVCFTV